MDIDKTLNEYARQLRRFFISRVKNSADADDLAQEVLLKTLGHVEGIREPEKFRSWLFAVARNTLVDHYRKSARYTNEDLSSTAALEDSPAVTEDLAKCIRPFVRQLPDTYRQVIEAVELEGTPQKQLAEELGMTYSALKSRVQRGRKMLGELFNACCAYERDRAGGILDFKTKAKGCDSCGNRP